MHVPPMGERPPFTDAVAAMMSFPGRAAEKFSLAMSQRSDRTVSSASDTTPHEPGKSRLSSSMPLA